MTDSPAPLIIQSLFDADGLRPGATSSGHAVFKLKAGEAVAGARPALTVVFAIDISSSMKGDPLAGVVDSMSRLLDLLEEQDRAGVVLFADEATVLQAPESVTPAFAKALKGRLSRVSPHGWTNIEAGLGAAVEVLPDRKPHERQVVILLSDGRPNRGTTTAGGLGQVVANHRPEVSVSTLGYGVHHDENVLHQMSEAGAGQYAFISDPVECAAEIARAVGAQTEVVAEQATLTVRPGEGVEIDGFVASPTPKFAADGLRLPLADFLSRDERSVVLRINVTAPREGGEFVVLDATLRFRPMGGGGTVETPCALRVPVRHQDPRQVKDAAIEVALAHADEARTAGWKLADEGHFDAAGAALRKVMTSMEAIDGYDAQDGSRLSEAYEQLVDEVMGYETKPSVEDYRNFRRVQMGMKMKDGAQHVSDRKAQGFTAQALAGATGAVGTGRLRITYKNQDHEQVVPLQREVTIGRVAGNEVVLASGSVSKRHARIVARDGKFILVDLRTTNGSYLNGKRINSPQILQPGDNIHIGDATLTFEDKDDDKN